MLVLIKRSRRSTVVMRRISSEEPEKKQVVNLTGLEPEKKTLFDNIHEILVPIFGFGGLAAVCGALCATSHLNSIPNEKHVEPGFVVPSELKIVTKKNNDGEKEVIMRYNGKNYLLKLDEYGNPTVNKND
ncbi:hypothetical protein KY311_02025 [Candidatus Woesearchaeota archaeon]|nr:hypothetical protein [Candidatus Woesearchaeota archaeon]